MDIAEMKTMNTGEKLPEFFYIFTDRYNQRLSNQIEAHNASLRDGLLVSAGFSNVLGIDDQKRQDFLNGDLEYLPYIKGNPTTIGLNSPFMYRIIGRYTLEYNLEICRKFHYKQYPSRFSGIFAFGNYSECEKMASKTGWDIRKVKKYRLKDMGIYNKYIKVVKANFKLIGMLENIGVEGVITPDMPCLYKHYWDGKGKIETKQICVNKDIVLESKRCGEVYEYLIEGILEEVHDE